MKPLVLVADDDPEERAALGAALVGARCDVLEARDGAEALEAIASTFDGLAPRPDAVVLDVCMPAMSGLGVLGALRNLDPRLPTFVVTGLADPSIDVVVARLGGVRVFRKPVDVEELTEAVRAVAQGPRCPGSNAGDGT